MGEKFAANPVTGTGSATIPIATSPGRSGFGPQLALAYDSGAGNGLYGFAWSLGVPQVRRKTDRGLPQYDDAAESDVFQLSDAEDLVPLLNDDGTRFVLLRPDIGYTIHRYLPRVEGAFARIERWTRDADGDAHWRSVSEENQLTVYGKDASSRIADPEDGRRVFAWLLCETRDDRGNAVIYEYKAEDGAGADLGLASERNRGARDDLRRGATKHLKRIRYGNRMPLLDDTGGRPDFLTPQQLADAGWMFEVVFDYGEHDVDVPTPLGAGTWSFRRDPFSSYRSGFEVRTCRLCRRVLMFHHFPDEDSVRADCLVRSTDFTYTQGREPLAPETPTYTYLRAVTQTGYRRVNGGYEKRSLPPVEFEYSLPSIFSDVREVDHDSLRNLPFGVDGSAYQWADLHGEGVPGILSEQSGTWFYKRNLTPLGRRDVEFGPVEAVAARPVSGLAAGRAQLMDLAGDGQPDLVLMNGPGSGFYEHDEAEGWLPFRTFSSPLGRDSRDPNLRLVDLDGDGQVDVLITEDDALVWHPSRGEDGFAPGCRIVHAVDEEAGPRAVFADGTQSIYLADMSGDGLTDLVRVRNGDVCYWPNLGYGRFGARVAMDHAPLFDHPDLFVQDRLRLADIDGTGTTDLIYLHRDGIRLYFNRCGNSWSAAQTLDFAPPTNDLVQTDVTDLFANGTASLVFSSAAPATAGRQMRYIDLMGGSRPHLLVRLVNNMGAETRIHYTVSSKFYLQDKLDGRPWITRLPFPVHVVERVEIFDRISRNRFVTRYAYHHGYFDGVEREFRGFGMVEQIDTEEFAALSQEGAIPPGSNVDAASHVPPILTKTWFHTGVYLGGQHVSDYYAGLLNEQDRGEYYREPGLTDVEARVLLLPDTALPSGLTADEEREACRALKGTMLRREVYGLDGSDRQSQPYAINEQNLAVRLLQAKRGNSNAVFHPQPNEMLIYNYERNPADPRIQHSITLEVDGFGNVLRSVAIGYGRRQSPLEDPADREAQTRTLVTYTENSFTDAVATPAVHRTPLQSEARTYELTGYVPAGPAGRFLPTDFVEPDPTAPQRLRLRFDSEVPYEQQPTVGQQRRLIECACVRYRPDDFGAAANDPAALLPQGVVEPLAMPGQTFKLAFTPGLVAQVFQRDGQPLLPNVAAVLGGVGDDQGGHVDLDGDGRWWVPSGRSFLSPGPNDSAAQEAAFARTHFFLSQRNRDVFGHTSQVTWDRYDLLVTETRDAVGNLTTAGLRDPAGNLTLNGNDYRVLQPRIVMDANRNRTIHVTDTLGLVAANAAMGKPEDADGDSLQGVIADLTEAQVLADLNDPFADPQALLGQATARQVYDVFAYLRTRDDLQPQPAILHSLAREMHVSSLSPGQQPRIQHSFAYTDGFGREIQRKVQAEAGSVPQRDPQGAIVIGPDGQPVMAPGDVSPRWVGTGSTISNNKGDAVRKYEPFFTDTHRFEFDVRAGVSTTTFYDPLGRTVAALQPDHTWTKTRFDPWRHEGWDACDTALIDPATDPDVGGFFGRLPDSDYLPTWHSLRTAAAHAAALAARYPDAASRAAETQAAQKTQLYAGTPSVGHLDALGRSFVGIAHNRFERNGALVDEFLPNRIVFDMEGNKRAALDAAVQTGDTRGRTVALFDYDMLGNSIHQVSMEAGERWTLNDATGKPIRAWDIRGFERRMSYDELRRPVAHFVTDSGVERMIARSVYGEALGDATNHRNQVHQQFDCAGVVTFDAYDFKGNLLTSLQQLTAGYKTDLDWSGPVALEADLWTTATTYDAVNRPVSVVTPDGSRYTATFNEANLLETVQAGVRGAAPTTFVTDVDYSAKGSRDRVVFGNGAVTTYEYDSLTLRLAHLRTTRAGDRLQDLFFTYDPAGNITSIRDDAQQTVFFDNAVVEPHVSYNYDALYMLTSATGREHVGQAGQPSPPSWDDAFRIRRPHPNDGAAMRRYTQRFQYDRADNLSSMAHEAGPSSWTRNYAYAEASHIEPARRSNRLSATDLNGQQEPYTYDVHGNVTSMPHLPLMRWDYDDRLSATSQQVRNDGGTPETTYYVYASSGQRIRKVTERQAGPGQQPTRLRERIYLSGVEVYREYDGAGVNRTLERQTLHVADDAERLAVVETRTLDTAGTDPPPQQLIRYQFGNQIGSATLELDGAAQVISYEEYYPYGGTSYQAVRSQVETPKRYRYSGRERDEESGLYCLGARYYAAWLGRWTAADPAGLVDGANLYRYARNNPVLFNDTGGTDPPPRRSSTSLGEFRLEFGHPLTDPLAFASQFDLVLPGAGGLFGNELNATQPGDSLASRLATSLGEVAVTGLLFYGHQVFAHEIWGHVGYAQLHGYSSHLTEFNWFTGETSGARPPAGTLADPTVLKITYAAGVNLQHLNGAATYLRTSRFRWLTIQDTIHYLFGQGGIGGYAAVSLLSNKDSDDLEHYTKGTGRNDAAPGPDAPGLLGLGALSVAPAVYLLIRSYANLLAGKRYTAFPSANILGSSWSLPNVQTLLTSQGTVFGATTMQNFGGGTSILWGAHARLTDDPAVSISGRVYGWKPRNSRLEVNPYGRLTFSGGPIGAFAGLELGFQAFDWLTLNVSGEAGLRDILSEVEGRKDIATERGGHRFRLGTTISW